MRSTVSRLGSTPGGQLDEAARWLPAPLLGIAPRPSYLLPLLRMGVLSGIVTRESADPGWAERFGAEMWDLEGLSGVRGAGAGDLRSRLHEVTRWDGRGFHVVSYGRYGARWTSALERAGAHELNQPSQTGTRPPRDKIAMREWFRALGVVAPASFVSDRVDYSDVRRRFGSTFVAQLPRGNGGDGTYLISHRDGAGALPPSDRWLISEYAGNVTVNFHGFVPGSGAPEVLRPSLQLTDVEGSGSSFGQYCGSDFRGPDRLPARALSRCREAVRRIGTGLGELGYRGVFGVDFAIRGENAYALEVNCRMQGSTWLLGEIELGEGSPPTMLRHLAERAQRTVAGSSGSDTRDATQLIVRHTGPPARLLGAPLSGVYRPHPTRLVRRDAGYGLLECLPRECAILNVPRLGTIVHPGAIIARVVTGESLTSSNGKNLTVRGQRLMTALRELYEFEPADSLGFDVPTS